MTSVSGEDGGRVPDAAKWALPYDDYPDMERLSVEYDVRQKYFPERARIIWNGNDDNTVFATAEEARWLSARLLIIAEALDALAQPTNTTEGGENNGRK